MRQTLPPLRVPRALGIDDFALKPRHRYATVLIDAETGERIDVLPDRTASAPVAWLRERPGAEVVCRDGSGCYGEAIREAPPAPAVCTSRPPANAGSGATRCSAKASACSERARRLDVALNTVKRYARLLLSHPESLRDEDTALLGELTSACREMTELARPTGEFARLPAPAEGHDAKLTNMWQMHGRAGFPPAPPPRPPPVIAMERYHRIRAGAVQWTDPGEPAVPVRGPAACVLSRRSCWCPRPAAVRPRRVAGA